MTSRFTIDSKYRSRVVIGGISLVFSALAASKVEAKVSEIRAGVFAHNIETNVAKNAGKEDGSDIQLEVLFESPNWLALTGSPRPSLVASLNTQGETSFAGISLDWALPLGDHFSVNPFLGYVFHTGDPLNNPYAPADSLRRAKFNAEELALGSRDLFRLGFAVSYAPNQAWSAAIVYEHLSHGYILGGGKNQGLDNLGVRLGKRF